MKMTLEQAVTILKSEQTKATVQHRPDIYQAYQIAIEAVKSIREAREMPYATPAHYLPGETK